MSLPKNVLGTELEPCSFEPLTGFCRDGYCLTGGSDHGVHVVCAVLTEEFLAYTASVGNDLSTPVPEYQFPGLKPGDRWCLCVSRWKEAHKASCAPAVNLAATHMSTLEYVDLETLKEHAVK